MTEYITERLQESKKVLERFLREGENIRAIDSAATTMILSVQAGGKILSCGNGGSMCDAMHFAEELTGRFREDRRPIPAISISDPSHITCTANDYGFEQVYSRYVEGVGNEGDVLLAISTSGNSTNVIRAAEVAREKGMKVVALTGKTGGLLGSMADVEIRVQWSGYSDRIQEVHIKIIHILIELLEQGLVKDR